MKKRNLTSLQLNKKSVSNLSIYKGGNDDPSGRSVTVCTFNDDCFTVDDKSKQETQCRNNQCVSEINSCYPVAACTW